MNIHFLTPLILIVLTENYKVNDTQEVISIPKNMASVSNGVKSWLLEKYAKQLEIESREGEANNSTAESLNSTKGGKEWKARI